MPTIKRKSYSNNRKLINDPYYHTFTWRAITKDNLTNNPFCYYCEKKGLTSLGYATDHQLPKRLFPELAETKTNLKTICKHCDGRKRAIERQCQNKEMCYILLKDFL